MLWQFYRRLWREAENARREADAALIELLGNARLTTAEQEAEAVIALRDLREAVRAFDFDGHPFEAVEQLYQANGHADDALAPYASYLEVIA